MSSEGMRPNNNIRYLRRRRKFMLKDLFENSWSSKAAHIYWLSYIRALYAWLSTSNSLTRTDRLRIYIFISIIGFIMQECKTAVYHLVGSFKSDSMLIWNCWFGNLCWLLSDQCHHLSSEWLDLPAPWKSNQSVMTKYGEIWKESLPLSSCI